MKPHLNPWNRLMAGARLASVEDRRDVAAPSGFATRIAARGLAEMEPTFSALFARLSLRAVGVCALLMVVGVAFNFGPVLNAVEGESVAVIDPVAEWLNAAS